MCKQGLYILKLQFFKPIHAIPIDYYRFQCIKENLSHSELLSIENIRDFRGAILIFNFRPLNDFLRMTNILF